MHDAIAGFIRGTLLIIGALFPIVNSPDNVPLFLTLTTGLSSENRAVLARKIAVNGFALLLVSILIGTNILAFFGVSLPVVQVGGGLIVVAAGWKLLNRTDGDDKASPAPSTPPGDSYLSERAFFPLTMPLTVGPGAISIAIAVGANRAPGSARWALPVEAILGCAIVAVTIFLGYRFAEPIGRVLGKTAMNILVRISSFSLVCIGVQIVWNGASALLRTLSVPLR
jgi:multiple antibiotic resistance protein